MVTRKTLGKTSLEVSTVGLGTAHIGLPPDLVYQQHVLTPSAKLLRPEVATATVIAAMKNGCSLIDTAPRYCNTASELAIGNAIRQWPNLARRTTITTKIGCKYPGDGFDHSYEAARSSLLESMERLGMSRFDVVYIHDPMGHSMEEIFNGTLRAMQEFQSRGIIKHIGVAINDPEVAADYIETGKFEVATVSGAWSLLNQTALKRIIPLARDLKVGLVVTTALERGILATGYIANRKYPERKFSPECKSHIRKIQTLCEDWNIPLGAAALQWCTKIPEVSSVIPGACSPEEAIQNLKWGSLYIPEEFWVQLKPLIKHFDIYQNPME